MTLLQFLAWEEQQELRYEFGGVRPVVFEILSTSPSRTDRIDKLREYQATRSILRYVILEQDSIAATVFLRQGTEWTAHAYAGADVLLMPEIGIEIPLADIYADAPLDAGEVKG